MVVLAFLVAMTAAFTGLFGLFIFFLSTVVGLIAPVAGIHKTHAMGVLMVPLILTAAGISWIFAAIGAYVRDLTLALQAFAPIAVERTGSEVRVTARGGH